MTDAPRPGLVKHRILVTLDTSAKGRAALAAAVQLAMNTSAELQGLFVEDEDLLRLASLPFASEVDFASATSRELQTVDMERALRAAAKEAQQAFADALRRLDVGWTFRILRGTVPQAPLASASDLDLLIIGQQGRSARVATSGYLPKQSEKEGPVVTVFDGSAAAFRTLELASGLAESSGKPLSVLVLRRNGDDVTKKCLSWLDRHGVRAEVDQINNPSENAIADFVNRWPPGILLINRDSEFAKDAQIRRLVDEFDCPLVLG